MGEIGNAIHMLLLLHNRGKMKIQELADIIGVKEGSIRSYRAQLEQAGIIIVSNTGRYGGYELNTPFILPNLDLSNEEKYSLLLVNQSLIDTNHVAARDISSLSEKIISFSKNTKDAINVHTAKDFMPISEPSIERQKLMIIHEAILSRTKIRINYNSLSSGISTRIVQPYLTYQHKGEMYLIGFCENRNDFRDFKICRIAELQRLKDVFERKIIDIKNVLKDSIGVCRDKVIDVKLRINYPMSRIVSEKQWVSNQKITELEEGAILFEAKMQGMVEIKSWILGMGSSVKVLGCEELVMDIKNEVEKIKNLYCVDIVTE